MSSVPDELLLARIRKETIAREAAISALYAALSTATEETQQKITAVASKLSASIDGRSVNSSAIAGVILTSQVEPGFAYASELTLLEAKVEDGLNSSAASIEELRTTTANQFESVAQQTLTIKAQFGTSSAYFQEQITANANATAAVTTRTTTLESAITNPTTGLAASHARISLEESARATADTALSTRTSSLEATVNSATDGNSVLKARIATEESARASADTAISTRTSSLEATVNSATDGNTALKARIASEESARASADTALATRASSLEATVNSTTDGNTALKARIASEESARATADTALSTSISTVSASVGGKNKTFYQSSTPTATAVGDLWIDTSGGNSVKRWNGSSWEDTQVAAGAIGAAVSTESNARASADTALGNNLYGRYALKVIAGNIVTGMEITSSSGGTPVSDITFQGANFKIYNGATGVVPFSVNTSTNTVTLSNVVVDTLAANIQITTPIINGGTFRLNGSSTISSTTAAGIVRLNGGNTDGSGSGGQVDVIGNSYTTVAGYAGSVLITPGTASDATVRLRDRTGTDRITINTSNLVDISNGRFSGSIFDVHPNSTNYVSAGEQFGSGGNKYLSMRLNNRTVYIPFFESLP